MKEIKRYKITSANGNSSNVTKCDDGHWVHYSDFKQLQARIKELESAERTLLRMGYKNDGGELWKPPIGKAPDFNFIDMIREKACDIARENIVLYQSIQEHSEGFYICPVCSNEMSCKDHVIVTVLSKVSTTQNIINEIKAQGVEEAIQALRNDCSNISDIDINVLNDFIEELRNNHE